jgi:phage terminase small subunit
MSKPDEKAIKREYGAGMLSLQAIADKYGITLKALRYMAGKNGWVRVKMQKGKGVNEGQKSRAKKSSVFAPKNTTNTAAENKEADTNGTRGNIGLLPNTAAFGAGLSEKEERFVTHYIGCFDKYEAHKKAGYTGGDRAARMLFRKVNVAREINRRLELMRSADILSGQDILRHWHDIATADPGEITQLRRCCCRYCWGKHFHYQWRDIAEYDRAAAKAASDGLPPPEYGGLGFTDNDDPNPECPRCGGEGHPEVFVADTRDITGPARRLIAGVKQTRSGIEVMTRDQDAALKNLAAFYHLAAGEQDRELRLEEIQRLRLLNEKIKAETERLRNGDNGNEPVIIHNSLKPPGAE